MARRRKFDFDFKERVLQFAEENSAEKAARHFNIDSKRVRYWRKQKGELLSADRSRARLAGGGRKKVNLQLERTLLRWIYSLWDKDEPVSGRMIRDKALEISASLADGTRTFVASSCWLQRFLQRHELPLRRRTAADRTDPHLLTETLVRFVDGVGRTVASEEILEKDIMAMDETAVCFDVLSPSAAPQGAKTRTLKTSAYERSHLTVVLTARADGTKLKPFIVFRGADGEVRAMRRQVSAAVVASSADGWMDDALTADWLQTVVGRVGPTRRLLVWDSYRRHISPATKAELTRFHITAAVIPAGCTKFAQAADVMWKQHFRQSLRDACGQWMDEHAGEDAGEDSTPGGSLKAPSRRLLVDWVVAAWDKLDTDLIRESFKVCGLSVRSDGSEDDLIGCLREGRPCAAGRERLAEARRRRQDDRGRADPEEEDEGELFKNELVIFDDEGHDDAEDEDFGEEDSDHVSWICFIHQAVPLESKKQIHIEEQQRWSPLLDQEDPEPPHIKEEQEDLWSSQDGEQLHQLEEADVSKFMFTAVPVKSEDDDDEEKPQTSQLHQTQTEAAGEDCGGPEPARNSDPERLFQPEDESEELSDPETDDSDDWRDDSEPQSHSNMWKQRLGSAKQPNESLSCGKAFGP